MNDKLKNVLLYVAGFGFGGFFVGIVAPRFSNFILSLGNNEIMAILTLFGAIIALGSPFIESKLQNRNELNRREYDEKCKDKNKKALYQIDIQVDTSLSDNMVCFSASVQNVGDKTIETKISNLYIDQGVPIKLANDRDSRDVGAKSFKFPFILEHRDSNSDGRPDCVLCKRCFRQNDDSYPEEIVDNAIKGNENLLRTHIVLEHLSHKSIQYINPKEKFSEDVVVQFSNSGVYRVTFFVGTAGEADCECATKQFYIPKSLTFNSRVRN